MDKDFTEYTLFKLNEKSLEEQVKLGGQVLHFDGFCLDTYIYHGNTLTHKYTGEQLSLTEAIHQLYLMTYKVLENNGRDEDEDDE